MSIELHHFFILADPGAPEADLLLEAGLIEGASNDHPGQGTANRRFFFPNTMLELIYIRDAVEARTGAGKDLRIVDRYITDGASPFGLVVRPLGDTPDVPFASWDYCADYLPPGKPFLIGNNSDVLEEPLCVCSPIGVPMMDPPADTINQNLLLTQLELSLPVAFPSTTLVAIASSGRITLVTGKPHHMALTFNNAQDGIFLDFRPELPLTFRR